jgi:uncharacterized membrane protein
MAGSEEQGERPAEAPGDELEPMGVSGEIGEVLEDLGVSPQDAPRATDRLLQIYSEGTTGDFPPPRMLAGYEQVMPGLANRIVVIAEQAAAAEVRETEAWAEDRRMLIGQRGRGQWMSVTLTLALILAAVVFFAVGNNTAGIAFLGGDVVLVGIALAGGVIDLPRKAPSEDNRDEGP